MIPIRLTVKSLFFVSLVLSSGNIVGQSTYNKVYQILQTKCSGAGCHNGSDATFNVSVSESVLYNALVGETPVNAAAASRGDKLVSPGDHYRSFLFRKINNGLYVEDTLHPNEGAVMPANPLSNYEIELVAQWILFGARQTGTQVDTAVLKTYYTEGGVGLVSAPPPPDPSEGFQVHIGRIFLPPGAEVEQFIKYNPMLSEDLEVTRVSSVKSWQLHHFIIYKLYTGVEGSFADGWRDTSSRSHGSADMFTSLYPQIDETELPPGTAYYLPATTIFDMDVHVKNYSLDSVMAAECYFNVYTQPVNTAGDFMFSRFWIDEQIVFPPHDTTTYTGVILDSSETRMWNIWILYTHTHKFGKDFDLWLRNPDGTIGQQVYEGFYDLTYSYNQGFYGTDVESPQKHFIPFLEVNPRVGLYYRAKWYNSSADTVRWGLTLDDEMLATGFQYVSGDSLPPLTGIRNEPLNEFNLGVFPNPANGSFMVNFALRQPAIITLELTNILGETVELLKEADVAGNHLQEINPGKSCPAGVYLLTLRTENSIATKRIVLE